MPTFSVVNKATSQEVYRYAADAAIEWAGMEFATHDHTEQVEQVEQVEQATVYGGRRTLTKLEFIELFTHDEYVGLVTAAKTNDALAAWIKLLEYATPEPINGYSVDLDNETTQMGVYALEALGLLAPGRAAEVLNG